MPTDTPAVRPALPAALLRVLAACGLGCLLASACDGGDAPLPPVQATLHAAAASVAGGVAEVSPPAPRHALADPLADPLADTRLARAVPIDR